MTTKTLREVTFTFDGDRNFTGLTDDTFWNGFLNVRVTPAVRDEIVAYFRTLSEPDVEEDFMSIPVVDGMVNLSGGFATYEAPTDHAIINGCPVIYENGPASVIDHPAGYMVYAGPRVGTYKTLKAAIRRADALAATA